MTNADLDAVFGALADPTRRAILARLASGEVTVNELAEPFAMSQPAVSKHLKVLERAGLVWHVKRPNFLQPSMSQDGGNPPPAGELSDLRR